MDTRSEPPAVEALIENLGWMRALARRLITDPHLADDALQETWFAASRSGIPADRPGRVWLAKVLRNRARAEHRSRAARERRERLTARTEVPVPDPGEIVAEAELGQRLGRAVLELEEPYRRTVLLRYWQGLGPDEIARVERVPASTVRTRLQRALERLRACVARDFEEEQGGWRRALLPLAALGQQPLVGGIMMIKKIQLAAGIVVAALAVGTVAWRLATPDPSVRTPKIDREDEVALLETPLTGEPELVDSPGVHDRVEAAVPAQVAGLVRAIDGRAVAGALLTLQVPPEREGVELAASDDQGRFLLDLPLDPEGRLVVRAQGFLEMKLWPEEFPHDPGSSFEVVLAPLGTLEVLVIDEHDAAVEGVTVRVRSHLQGAAEKAWTRDVQRVGLTGSDGRAALEELPCGVALSVTLGSGPIMGVTEIDPATQRSAIEVRRATPGTVAGTVLDATGAPAEGVTVVLEESRLSWNRQALTDSRGRYSFADEVSPGPIEVRARRVGTESITGSVTGVLEPGATLELEPLRMAGLVSFAGRVVAELDVNLRDLGLDLLRDGERLLEEVVWLDDEGRFETRVPPGPVLVRVAQHATVMISRQDESWERGSLRELGEVGRGLYTAPATWVEIAIDNGIGALEGELVTLAGAALEGGRVSLHFYSGEATIEELLHDQRAFLWQQIGLALEGGHFRSRAIRTGTYHVAVEVDGVGTAWIAAVRVDPGGLTDLGSVTLKPATGIIRGRVVTADGAAVPSAVVTLRLPWDDKVGGNVVAGADGGFLARDLPCGAWRVQAASEGVGKSEFVVVTVDGSGEREIELVLAAPARVRVRLSRDGAAVGGHELSLGRPRDGRVVLDKFAVTNTNGEAAFEWVTPGRVVVFATTLGGRSLEVAPGDDILVEFELGGEVVEVELSWRGAPLERIGWCGLLDVDPRSATHGELHYGETLADGRVRLRTFAGASLLLANSKSFEPAATLAQLVDGPRIPAHVAFSERALELELETTAARRHAPAPRLVLAGVMGGAHELPWPHTIILPVERTLDGATRWPSVPAGVRLELVGTDASGAERVRAVNPRSAPGRVRWR